ncbi:hypothetical protein DPMN_178987 [Dreissena polymorpha]|uniref:Uncharacterized protein n=1 Tax=Dreissena polymorpha TaxID=45954 RepID=A0A9D4EG35_DREPO|nr:hypothetical protein DPMN_178987 [Dreissena polymorpha]
MIPTDKCVNCNEYVAIEYQDAWYSGIVVEIKDEENFVVKFMTPTRALGQYEKTFRRFRNNS